MSDSRLVRDADSSSSSNDLPNRTVRPSIGAAAVTIPKPRTQAVAPSLAAQKLIQKLHDEMRADIPDKKFPIVGNLLAPPWKQDRIGRVAVEVDNAIDARLAEHDADVDARIDAAVEARIDAAVEAALLRQSKSRRRAA